MTPFPAAFLYLLTHPALNLAAAAFALGLRVGRASRRADEREGVSRG